MVGRLALGPVADRVGLLRTYRTCFAAIGVSFVFWLWPAGPSYPVLAVHAAVLGVGYGGFLALLPGVLAERFGLRQFGGLLGIAYTSHVIGAGLGPLMTGLLISVTGTYRPARWRSAAPWSGPACSGSNAPGRRPGRPPAGRPAPTRTR